MANHHSAISHSAKIFGRIEAEATHFSPRSCRSIEVGGTDRLRGIFDDGDVMRLPDTANAIHGGALSEQMNRNDRSSS